MKCLIFEQSLEHFNVPPVKPMPIFVQVFPPRFCPVASLYNAEFIRAVDHKSPQVPLSTTGVSIQLEVLYPVQLLLHLNIPATILVVCCAVFSA